MSPNEICKLVYPKLNWIITKSGTLLIALQMQPQIQGSIDYIKW